MDKVFGGVRGLRPQKLKGFCPSEIDLWWLEKNIAQIVLERTIAPYPPLSLRFDY
jgi:hypothetical protein